MATRATPALLDLEALPRDLTARERAALRDGLRALLQFHRALGRWPSLPAPRATPIVAIYDGGVLRGCAVHRGAESGPERLGRAFLAAAASLVPAGPLAAQLFYPRTTRWLDDVADLDVGREGLALVRPGLAPVLLMPQVARDHGVDAPGMLHLLLDKARLAALPSRARLIAWTVDTVVAREDDDVEAASAREAARTGATAADYAAAWLVRMVDARGRVAFALDPRTRVLQLDGPLRHARSAIAIEALAAYAAGPGPGPDHVATAGLPRRVRRAAERGLPARGRPAERALAPPARGHAIARGTPARGHDHERGSAALRREAGHAVARARRWLGDEISRALRGRRVLGWPDDRATVAGTLALACLAGVPVRDPLRALVAAGRWRELASPAWPWHAGQVALVLRHDTPDELWRWCLDDLRARPFAPYLVLAARARGDDAAHRRAADAVARFIGARSPHSGGATATALPETGLTAVAAHALAASRHRTPHAAALAFVHARQLLPERIPASLDPALALGGFAATPVDDTQRADITGHALLALLAG